MGLPSEAWASGRVRCCVMCPICLYGREFWGPTRGSAARPGACGRCYRRSRHSQTEAPVTVTALTRCRKMAHKAN